MDLAITFDLRSHSSPLSSLLKCFCFPTVKNGIHSMAFTEESLWFLNIGNKPSYSSIDQLWCIHTMKYYHSNLKEWGSIVNGKFQRFLMWRKQGALQSEFFKNLHEYLHIYVRIFWEIIPKLIIIAASSDERTRKKEEDLSLIIDPVENFAFVICIYCLFKNSV